MHETLKQALAERQGNEDDYLGITTFPVRKWAYKIAIPLIKRCIVEIPTSNAKMESSSTDSAHVWALPTMKVKGFGKGFCAGFMQSTSKRLPTRKYMRNWSFDNTAGHDQFACTYLDGWTRLEVVSLRLSRFVSVRVFHTLTFSTCLDDGSFIDIRLPIAWLPKVRPPAFRFHRFDTTMYIIY